MCHIISKGANSSGATDNLKRKNDFNKDFYQY